MKPDSRNVCVAFFCRVIIAGPLSAQNTLPASGNVGIGTTPPNYALDVNGDINLSGTIRYQSQPLLQYQPALENIFMGFAGNSIGNGGYNLALGHNALGSNTLGTSNVAIGFVGMSSNTTGYQNIAIGSNSLQSNTTGSQNISVGVYTLGSNITGAQNVAVGQYALLTASTGNANVGLGVAALFSVTTGSTNTAIGNNVLTGISTGYDNVAVGDGAGDDATNGSGGIVENTSGSQNIYLGSSTVSLLSGDTNETVIGTNAIGYGSNSVTLGNTSVASTVLRGNILLTNGGANGPSGASITFPDSTVQSTAWNGTTLGGDYAEAVDVRGDRAGYEPGDVIVIDPAAPGMFLKSGKAYSRLVAGVYSTRPGLLGRRANVDRPDKSAEVPMAMMGIVPTKVSGENGPIEPGDLLVSSSTPGYAMKGTDRDRLTGAVIGKALAPMTATSGVIEVLVSLQ